jgi:DNA-binding CsgD family transcriptional regulator
VNAASGPQRDQPRASRNQSVWVISSSAVLAAAVAAGLAALGWAAAQPVSTASDVVDSGPFNVVLLADENGRVVDPFPDLSDGAEAVVVIASRGSGQVLFRAVERGFGVVDADLPLAAQLRATDRALASAAGAADSGVAALVRSWVADADRIDRLTSRELEILDRIMCGESAAAVAAHLMVEVTTVRTHIRSILSKLDVPSQLAAAAVACRSRCGPGDRRCGSHQF